MYGSFSRLKDSLENITIFLVASYVLSYDVFIQYKSIYSESLWPLLLLLMSVVFIMFSIPGIINRFFTLRFCINSLNKEEMLSPPKNADTNLNGELLSLKAINQKLEKEIIFLEAENNRLREKDSSLKEQSDTERYI